jgi:prevent-host-death family protein
MPRATRIATSTEPSPASQSSEPAPSPAGHSSVGIRDLRADVAALVRRAGAGEHVVISVAGRPLAHLGPLRSVDGQIQLVDLVASGRVLGPRRTGSYSAPDPVPVWQGSRIDRLLQEIR